MTNVIALEAAREKRRAKDDERFLYFTIFVWPTAERGVLEEIWTFTDGLYLPAHIARGAQDEDATATDLSNIIEGEIGCTGSLTPSVFESEELGVTYGLVGIDLDGRGVARFACLAEEAARYPYATARARLFVRLACREAVRRNPRKRWRS